VQQSDDRGEEGVRENTKKRKIVYVHGDSQIVVDPASKDFFKPIASARPHHHQSIRSAHHYFVHVRESHCWFRFFF
jgi:hypothetical protein